MANILAHIYIEEVIVMHFRNNHINFYTVTFGNYGVYADEVALSYLRGFVTVFLPKS